jgi:Tfp pilus assembly protein PilV
LDERGHLFIEVLLALSIFSLALLPCITIYRQLTEEVQNQAIHTHAYWLVYEAVERWKSGSDIRSSDPGQWEIVITEQLISPTVLEGEFRIQWNHLGRKKQMQMRAYKKVATH